MIPDQPIPTPPERQLPAPWDASPAQRLLALVYDPALLLHVIDVCGGSITSGVLHQPLKSWALRFQFAGVLKLATFVLRPRSARAHESCLLWIMTDAGRAYLAELRAIDHFAAAAQALWQAAVGADQAA